MFGDRRTVCLGMGGVPKMVLKLALERRLQRWGGAEGGEITSLHGG